MAQKGYELIFGAGLCRHYVPYKMQCIDHNGTVIGVMPKELDTKEITSQRVSELILVDLLHQRKRENGRISRCFYPAPGGAGSLEEFLKSIVGHKLVFIKTDWYL